MAPQNNMKKLLCALCAGVAFLSLGLHIAKAWSLEEASKDYKGTEIKVIFLDRPGYRATIKMLPEFEQKTGIKVSYEIVPYESTREKEVLDFSAQGDLSIALVDLVWLGEFAESGWIVPIDELQKKFPNLTDPDLDLNDFFPLLLNAFGTWNNTVYGLPFDNYSGLLFYNKTMLSQAGFDKPPETWDELLNVYGPKLTGNGKYAFALQSRRGETQSCDSFMRFIWPWGGSLLDAKFQPNLSDPKDQEGLEFRQKLEKIMPPGIVDFDHNEAVNALAQGQVAMITEWSAFYSTLVDPKTSKIVNDLAVAPEPKGPAGRKPALGGFSLAVAKQADDKKQGAAWLFIEWVTSKAKAKEYVENGGVSGRQSTYQDKDFIAKYPFIPPMVESWQQGVPEFRPRFAEWPQLSEIIAEWGTKMMDGQATVKQASDEIDKRVEDILKKAGYYDGKKTLAQ
jgi:multiple sugar transport system substrate-binding protein